MSWPPFRSVLALGSWPGTAAASAALPRSVEVSTAALLGVVFVAVALALALGWMLGRRAARERPESPPRVPPGPGGGAGSEPPEAPESGDDATERLAYTLSHDLRAPLRSVEGFARIVKEDYGPQLDRVANDHLDRIVGAAGRMNAMIDAMLSLARLSAQPLQREPVNLSQLAGWVVEDLRRQHPGQPVQATVAPDLSAQGDPALLRVVLENLLGNAWKYSSRNPAARVAFERVEHQGRPAFVVRDNGAGFDMRAAGRLFGLFQRLHGASEFPGHGLGLASVRRIVQRHGGRVWAESEPGRGARFYFTLGG
jgi:signal transduction histidine kinase